VIDRGGPHSPGKGTMLRITSLTIALTIAAATAAYAQFPPQPAAPKLPGSAEDREACQPDVKRFCQQRVPPDPNAPVDPFAIASCLQQHRTQISAKCNAVLTGAGR
jgi:hypothetical protein